MRSDPQLLGSAPLLAGLLGISTKRRYGRLRLSPQQQRDQTIAALIAGLRGLARQQPVLWIIEDVHWIDPTTVELIELTLDQLADMPVRMLLTTRPAFQAAFARHPEVTQLALNRLSRHYTSSQLPAALSGATLSFLGDKDASPAGVSGSGNLPFRMRSTSRALRAR